MDKLEKPVPTRIIINEHLDAVAPHLTETFYNTVFIRKDGWSVGVNNKYVDRAIKLYEDSWEKVWFDGEYYSFNEYVKAREAARRC
jgi:hypothetical protein